MSSTPRPRSSFFRSPSLSTFTKSSIGRKLIVALTGLALVLFLAGHLSGNLLIFAGREAFNDYAQFLHGALHGAGVWIARIGLLVIFVAHIWFTIMLTRENRAARDAYAYEDPINTTRSSRWMIWSGLTILAFVIYHLLHFTVKAGSDYGSLVDAAYQLKTGEVRHDAWQMVIYGFSHFLNVVLYLVAMTCLCSHLHHGVASIFQTLGLRTEKTEGAIGFLSKAYSLVIYLGFISIPIAIYFFGFGR